MEAVLRGLKALEAARPPRGPNAPFVERFDAAHWLNELELRRQRDQLPAVLVEVDALVDDIWHLSYLQRTGGGAGAMRMHGMGISSHTYKHVEATNPASVVLHACSLEAPPRPSTDYREAASAKCRDSAVSIAAW